MTTLLLDADILAYKAAAIGQDDQVWPDGEVTKSSNWNHTRDYIHDRLERICDDLELPTSSVLCCLSDDDHNWRKDVLPSYKGNRKETEKPELLAEAKRYIAATWPTKAKPSLEADDVMGILMTHPKFVPGEKIIVSEDKDMLTIPGTLFNPDRRIILEITEEEADMYHLFQTLTGDPTDGYKGCHLIGKAKASQYLLECCSWDTVLSLFLDAGHTPEEALVQAQVARICRANNFNFKTQEVIPWQPR